MTGSELAALIVAIGGLLAGVLAGLRNLRGDRFRREVESSAHILAGYGGIIERLQAEVVRLSEARERDAEAHERRERELEERIDELASQVFALRARLAEVGGL